MPVGRAGTVFLLCSIPDAIVLAGAGRMVFVDLLHDFDLVFIKIYQLFNLFLVLVCEDCFDCLLGWWLFLSFWEVLLGLIRWTIATFMGSSSIIDTIIILLLQAHIFLMLRLLLDSFLFFFPLAPFYKLALFCLVFSLLLVNRQYPVQLFALILFVIRWRISNICPETVQLLIFLLYHLALVQIFYLQGPIFAQFDHLYIRDSFSVLHIAGIYDLWDQVIFGFLLLCV